MCKDLGIIGDFNTKVVANAMSNAKNLVITVNNRAGTRQAIINAYRSTGKNFTERSTWSIRKNIPKPENISDSTKKNMEYDWNYTKIAIHHAGMSYSCGAEGQLQKVEKKHMDENKWPNMGYHYAMDCQGNVFEACDIRYKGSHLVKYNTGAIGIVLLEDLTTDGEGGVSGYVDKLFQTDKNYIPPYQQQSLEKLINILRTYFKIKELGGHREFPHQSGRYCPGNLGIAMVNSIRLKYGLSAPKK